MWAENLYRKCDLMFVFGQTEATGGYFRLTKQSHAGTTSTKTTGGTNRQTALSKTMNIQRLVAQIIDLNLVFRIQSVLTFFHNILMCYEEAYKHKHTQVTQVNTEVERGSKAIYTRHINRLVGHDLPSKFIIFPCCLYVFGLIRVKSCNSPE